MKKVVIYGRTSTDRQTVENQLHVLREVATQNGWSVVGEYLDEGISGSFDRTKRPKFDELLKDANRRKFQSILVWDISRLGRSLQTLVEFLSDIQSKGIDLYIHNSGLDTSTHTGKMMFQMVGVFAEFERNIIRDRVMAGMDRAKVKGTKSGKSIGRPSNVNASTKAAVIALRENGYSLNKISRELSIGSGTIYKLLDKAA